MKCKVCGNDIGAGCKPAGMELCQSRYYTWLNKDEWEDIYGFFRIVYLPFIHSVLANAEERIKKERKDK